MDRNSDIAEIKDELRVPLRALIGVHATASAAIRALVRRAVMDEEITDKEKADAKMLVAIAQAVHDAVELLSPACGVELELIAVSAPRGTH